MLRPQVCWGSRCHVIERNTTRLGHSDYALDTVTSFSSALWTTATSAVSRRSDAMVVRLWLRESVALKKKDEINKS